jgi:rubrerythrin
MKKFESIDEALDFAISREQEAVDFYVGLAERVENPTLRKALEGFASSERGHKRKLEATKQDPVVLSGQRPATDLHVGDYLVDIQPAPDISYQDALVIAMKREAAAMQLYADLAASTDDAGLQELFAGLAKEESHHKHYFESAYDEHFLSEN